MTRKQLTLLVGFLMLLSFLAGNLLNRNVLAEPVSNLQTSLPVNTDTQKWEYKIIASYQDKKTPFDATINKWADQGFELAEFETVYDSQSLVIHSFAVIKRPKK
jgi:hypothetical protein